MAAKQTDILVRLLGEVIQGLHSGSTPMGDAEETYAQVEGSLAVLDRAITSKREASARTRLEKLDAERKALEEELKLQGLEHLLGWSLCNGTDLGRPTNVGAGSQNLQSAGQNWCGRTSGHD